MAPQSSNSRFVNDDDSLFSIESFKNRVNIARSVFSELSSTDEQIKSTPRSEKGNKRDRDGAVSPLTIMSGDKITYSPRDNQTYTSSSSSNHHSSSEPLLPPAEIALLHRETDMLLDSIRGDDNTFISPLKDDFHQYNEEDHQLNQLLKCEVNSQEDVDDLNDNASVSSIFSDDDGMKNEVRKLKFAIKAIRKDIAVANSTANLIIGTCRKSDELSEQHLDNSRSASRRIIPVMTIMTLCSLGWIKYRSIRISDGVSNCKKESAIIERDELNPICMNNIQNEVTQKGNKNQDDFIDLDIWCPRHFTLELL